MASVTLRNLEKIYPGNVAAVKDLSLEIRDHEFVTLLGPSGCGKTTTLNLIAGLIEPSSGDILIGQRRVNDVPPQERDCAMVFQTYAVYPHMTVFENLAFPLRRMRLREADIQNKVQETAKMLGMEQLLQRPPKNLSGGQRQRVALGRALVRSPQVFLMDEPLSNLDARLRLQMRMELRRLHNQTGATTVYVTHDQAEAMTLSDRIAVMNEGVLQQCDTPRVIYDSPANVFVARFMGEYPINLLPMMVEQVNGLSLRLGDQLRNVDDALAEYVLSTGPARDLLFGVRPEAIHVLHERPANGSFYLDAVVELVQEYGPNRVIHMKIGTALVTAVVDGQVQAETDERVFVTFDPRGVVLFRSDDETGYARPARQGRKRTKEGIV